MKRFLKFILIFIIITSGIWIIFDDYIVRYLIIQETEKFTNKKVTLDDVNLYYFPNLKIELINLKVPNPDQDNFILKSKQIVIDIDLEQLLKKKLIINEINSNSTKFFDTSEKTERIENKEGNKKPNAKIKKDQKEILNSFLKLPPDIFQTSQIVSNLTETLTFDEEHTEINQIINKSNEILVNKKDKIINLSNTSLYEINSLSVNSITSVDDLKFTEKKLNEINDNLQLLKSEAYNLKELYYKTLSQVNEIKASMNLKIDNAFSFSVNSEKSKNDNHNESINLAIYIKNKLKEVSFNKKKPPGKKSFKGITYQFSKDTYPTFLLKKIEINTAESNDYLKGVNLTFDRKFRNKSKIYFKQMNKPNYEKIIFFANGTATNNMQIDLRVTSLRLPSYKIVETDDFEFNFKENQNTMFFFNGDLGLSNNLSGNIIIKEPNYKLINKKPNSSPINDLIAFINNKDIQFNFYIDGSIDNLTINTETNLPQIIKLAKDEVLSTKIKRFNKIKRRQIKKIKSENNNKIDTEIAKFSNQYEQIEYSANFQIIEIENQINVNKSNIQKKQDEIKTSLEESIKSSINNLNI